MKELGSKSTIPVNSKTEMRILVGQRNVSNWGYQRRVKKSANSYGDITMSSFDNMLTELSNKMYAYLSKNEVIIGYLIGGDKSQVFRTVEELRSSWSFKYKVIAREVTEIIVSRYSRKRYSEDTGYPVPIDWVEEVLQRDREFLNKVVPLKYALADGTEVTVDVTNETMLSLENKGRKVSVNRYKQ